MKKVVSSIVLIIFSMFSIMGCTNQIAYDQSKIVAPTAINSDLYGVWNIGDKYNINYENIYKNSIEDINTDKIYIYNDKIILGSQIIDNPQYKLKRVKVKSMLDDFLYNTNKVLPRELGYANLDTERYIDVISIHDNNNSYFSLLKESEDSYILITDKSLFRLSSGEEDGISKSRSNEEISSYNIASPEATLIAENDSYNDDVGVLLGLKTPSEVNDDGGISEPSYRTLWIHTEDNELKEVVELDKLLLLPRINGFTKISVNSTENKDIREETLTISTNKNNEKESKSIRLESDSYKEITFVGNDYIGMQYYYGSEFDNNYSRYRILPIDSINSTKGIDIVSLFGEHGIEDYEQSKQSFIERNKEKTLSSFDLSINDYENISPVRENGKWVIKARINSKNTDQNYIEFPLGVSPIKVLVNYDDSILSWSKAKLINESVRDTITSPNGRISLMLVDKQLKIYELTSGKIRSELDVLPIADDEVVVMAEWATRDFVSKWNDAVKEYSSIEK